MEGELSLVKFQVLNFFSLIMTSRPFAPITTILIKVVDCLLLAEPDPDIRAREKVKWIYDNTHSKVNVPLPIIELAVFKNLDKGLSREIEIEDKTFSLIELYRYLDEISIELAKIVVNVAKKYSLDIPMQQFGTGEKVKISVD
jgi:hypothetical protein